MPSSVRICATTSFCSGNSRAIGLGFGMRSTQLSTAVIFIDVLSLALQLHVFVRRRERIGRDQPEAGFCHARSHAVQERELVDRGHDRAVVHELLEAME